MIGDGDDLPRRLQWSGETVKRKVVEPWGLADAERSVICEEKIWLAQPWFVSFCLEIVQNRSAIQRQIFLDGVGS